MCCDYLQVSHTKCQFIQKILQLCLEITSPKKCFMILFGFASKNFSYFGRNMRNFVVARSIFNNVTESLHVFARFYRKNQYRLQKFYWSCVGRKTY